MHTPRALTTAVGAVLTAAALLAGCAPVPAAGPPLAVSGSGPRLGGDNAPEPEPGDAPDPAEDLPAISPDAEYEDCTYLDSTPPDGVDRQCITFYAGGALEDMDAELYAAVLSGPDAPRDRPPLVVLSGADRDFEATTTRWEAAVRHGLKRPVVVVEPRTAFLDGTHCENGYESIVDELAGIHADPNDGHTREETAALARGCQDPLGEDYLEFGSRQIAEDLLILLDELGLDKVVLGSSGSGVRALARFATDHPERIAALVVDSPTTIGTDYAALAAAQAEGTEMALGTWMAQCRAEQCVDGLPPEPPRAGASAPSVPLASALRTSRDALSRVDRVDPAADVDRIRGLWQEDKRPTQPDRAPSPTGVPSFYATCTDFPQRPDAHALPAVIKDLSERFPTYGRDVGTRMLQCSDWPVVEAAPIALPAVDVLVLGATGGDPLAGRDPAGTGTAEFTGAGAAGAVPLRWGGYGSTAVGYNSCVSDGISAFLDDPAAAAPSACPA